MQNTWIMLLSGRRIPVSWLYLDEGYLYHGCIWMKDICTMVVSGWRRWCRIPVSWLYLDEGYLYHGCIRMKDTCYMVVSGYRIPVSWLYQDTGYLHHGCIRMKKMMQDTSIMVVSGWRGWWRIPVSWLYLDEGDDGGFLLPAPSQHRYIGQLHLIEILIKR